MHRLGVIYIGLHRYDKIYVDYKNMPKNLISISEAAKQVGASVDTLRRWDKSYRLPSIRIGPRGHRFYSQEDIHRFLRNDISVAKQWTVSTNAELPTSDVYCPTRDTFQARLEKLQSVLQGKIPDSSASLLCAISGEIGNNSFDHNLGNWPDVTGVYFSYSLRERTIVLADRGLGILRTLKRVRSELSTSSEALKVAFTETLSGRFPEARGNGLKFVRSVIIKNAFTLRFQTGNALLLLKEFDKDVVVSQTNEEVRGCVAIIGFEKSL